PATSPPHDVDSLPLLFACRIMSGDSHELRRHEQRVAWDTAPGASDGDEVVPIAGPGADRCRAAQFRTSTEVRSSWSSWSLDQIQSVPDSPSKMSREAVSGVTTIRDRTAA